MEISRKWAKMGELFTNFENQKIEFRITRMRRATAVLWLFQEAFGGDPEADRHEATERDGPAWMAGS